MTKAMVGRVADAVLLRSRIAVPGQPDASRSLRVLAYHSITSPESFAEQLRRLRQHWRPVSLGEVCEALHHGKGLPHRAVLVTFDDGDPTVLSAGLPALRRYEVPAALFSIAGLVGTHEPPWWIEVNTLRERGVRIDELRGLQADAAVRFLKKSPDVERRGIVRALRLASPDRVRHENLGWEDLRELERDGVEIGNHTLTHPCLDRCSSDVVEDEIRRAHEALSHGLGRPPRAFAFPNGNYDPRAVRCLQELGYECAFLFDHRIERWPPEDTFKISRLRVSSEISSDRFELILSGTHPALHHALGRA